MIKQYLDEALADCETLLSSQPSEQQQPEQPSDQQWMQACQTVANILTSMGFIQEAYPWRSMAFDLVPNNARFYAESGRVCSQCEAWEKAIYFCQRTLECDPDNVTAHRQLAKVYNRLGDYTAELQTMNQLLEKRPEVAEAEGHYQLGQVLRGQQKLSEAIACYQRAIKQDSQYEVAYYALGNLWGQQGNQGRTVELFQQMVEQLPKAASAHYRLGRAYRQTQQVEQAIESFKAAITLDPQLHWAYIGLLNILMQRSLWDDAIALCESVIESARQQEQDIAWAYCFIGNAQAKKGDRSLATRAHQQAFSLRGWPQAVQQDYQFNLSWFSESIPIWEQYTAQLNELSALRHPLKVLSLGSQDDSSLLWLVDTVLVEPDDQLICLSNCASERLQKNRAKLTKPDKLVLREGNTEAQLAELSEEMFDLIYIQSDRKEADYLQQMSVHLWKQLKVSGLMCFRNYQWKHPSDPGQAPKVGIDAFIASVGSKVEVLRCSYRVILRKRA